MILGPLDEVFEEFFAVRQAVARMQAEMIDGEPSARFGTNRRSVGIALQRLEGTYLVRLFATFEDELQTLLGVPDLPLARLVELAATSRDLDSDLVTRIHALRRTRNEVAHASGTISLPVPLGDALEDMKRFLAKCRRRSRV